MKPEKPVALRLVVRDLHADRGEMPILKGIHFTLHAGESLVVTGPNGCGKSTLLRVLAGLLPPEAGGVTFEGAGEAGWCHYVGHQNAMKGGLSLRDNLAFWRGFLEGPAASLEEAIAAVRLERVADLPFGYLSAGQRRRAALARLFLHHRPVWLLDEPTAGLDTASRERLAEAMREHLGKGGMIVAATHEPLGLESARHLELERQLEPGNPAR